LSGGGSATSSLTVTSGTVNGSGLTVGGPFSFNGAANSLEGTVSCIGGVTVASSATLNLLGTLTGPLTLASGSSTLTGGGVLVGGLTVSGGTVMPGTASAVGRLTTADASFADGSTLTITLNSDTATPSVLNSNGNLTLGTGGDGMALLSVSDLGVKGSTLAANTTFSIITTTGSITGQFSGLAEGATVNVVNGGSNVYTIDYLSNEVNLIANASVPEPSSLSLLGVGALGLLARRSRKSLGMRDI
jgi:fibronectin-binding autotransporter adhesin